MSQDHHQPTPHVDYCRRDAEIVTLTMDMKVVKGQMNEVLTKLSIVEHALVGDLEKDKTGLLVEHKEHRHTLYGRSDKDNGLVGDMKWVKSKMQESKAFAAGMAATFGLIGSGLAFFGFEGLRWIAMKLNGHQP